MWGNDQETTHVIFYLSDWHSMILPENQKNSISHLEDDMHQVGQAHTWHERVYYNKINQRV